MENGEEVIHADLLTCMTLSDSCPFISTSDSRLVYFGAGLFSLYVLFFAVLLVDVVFWRNIEKIEKSINNHINTMQAKKDSVRSGQHQMKSLQAQIEEEMMKSQDSLKTLCYLRSIARDLDTKNFDKVLAAVPADEIKMEGDSYSKWNTLDDLKHIR